ncbi:hypothetical protein APHAL10511_000664 [Amanita phalloides]|nr:hypothetical protein APHAL10511_000664 [Amanita phalloides]
MKPLQVSKPDSTLLLRHAWTRAAQSDSTLIIFHCGNFERIGFRHRDSQTLCLSDLIDVSKSPKYGQLQVELYIAILKDALDRTRQVNTRSEETKRKKRKQPDTGCTNATRRSKRHMRRISGEQNRNVESVDEGHSILLRETGRRNLALLRLQYGVFNSPAPAALYRIGCATSSHDTVDDSLANYPKKRTYAPEEYFRITLTSEIAEGAIGKVHNAVIEIQTNDGRIDSCVGVVKIALEKRKQEKLRHEYAVYRYMATKKVKHVAIVYGLFEDAADEAMILVMSHAGISLVTQSHYREHGEVSLTELEQTAFKAAMTEIHNAGVRHYDIRPENLMMDDQGRATIIDFDIAKRAILSE